MLFRGSCRVREPEGSVNNWRQRHSGSSPQMGVQFLKSGVDYRKGGSVRDYLVRTVVMRPVRIPVEFPAMKSPGSLLPGLVTDETLAFPTFSLSARTEGQGV
jgi:hypothetical protein